MREYSLLWGGEQPGLPMKQKNTTVFRGDLFQDLYLSLYMFTGKYGVSEAPDGTKVIAVQAYFRNALPAGNYPYPFWHSDKKWDAYEKSNEVRFHVAEDGRIIFAGRFDGGSESERGPYALQAAIAACHARALTPEETDWVQIARLYIELVRLVPSPVVELNRAVAVAMAFGPQAGLDLVDALMAEPTLQGYHLLPSVRGDFLYKLGRLDEAQSEFERAAALTRNLRERELLLDRARSCAGGSRPPEPRG